MGALLKWIRCEVAPHCRHQHDAAQRAWTSIADIPGFGAQVGGWDANDAYVLGHWRDQEAYRRFMTEQHDGIAPPSAYEALTLEVLAIQDSIPGPIHEKLELVRAATLLRVAECRVRPGRQEHFDAMQRHVWNPWMALSPGLLGGWFARSTGNPQDYRVFTLWESSASHEAYERENFPILAHIARPEDDAEAVRGLLIPLVRPWTVTARGPRIAPGASAGSTAKSGEVRRGL